MIGDTDKPEVTDSHKRGIDHDRATAAERAKQAAAAAAVRGRTARKRADEAQDRQAGRKPDP
jgi:hypothetical protein